VAAEISPVGITLETLREIQVVIQKAEDRREEWRLREEQMRSQIGFWRNKAEELDGELTDSREANGLLRSENASYENQIKTMKATLTLREKNYDGTQDTRPEDYTLPPKK
jgi:chromosome segregation ATPase